MTIRELLEIIKRIEDLRREGYEPDWRSYCSEENELARLLAIELEEEESNED